MATEPVTFNLPTFNDEAGKRIPLHYASKLEERYKVNVPARKPVACVHAAAMARFRDIPGQRAAKRRSRSKTRGKT